MIRLRHHSLLAILIVSAALVAACQPGTGALGTPASPVVTAEPSGEPSPSDVAPATASPSPSVAPSVVPSASPSSDGSAGPTHSAPPTATPGPTGTTIVRAYFLLGSFTGNGGLVPVLREVPQTKAVAAAAMHALLDGPNADEMSGRPAMYTSVPVGTRLLGVSIKNGLATVNVSQELAHAAAMLQAAGQVVYTLTQFSTVDAVRIQVEGQDLADLHLVGPVFGTRLTRGADFQVVEGMLPAIFIDRPAWGASLGNPGRVSGLANVFEATFKVQLLNANGKVLVDQQVMATCGTGCWGTFKVDLAYAVAKAQYGTLRVFDLSAKDGSIENLTEYKVWLKPAG